MPLQYRTCCGDNSELWFSIGFSQVRQNIHPGMSSPHLITVIVAHLLDLFIYKGDVKLYHSSYRDKILCILVLEITGFWFLVKLFINREFYSIYQIP